MRRRGTREPHLLRQNEFKTIRPGAEPVLIRWQDCVYTARIRGIYWNWFDTRKKELPLAAGTEEGDIFINADAVSGKTQQKQAWKTGRSAGIPYSVPTHQKDSGIKKSYMGIVRKEKIGYSKDSYQILNRTQV